MMYPNNVIYFIVIVKKQALKTATILVAILSCNKPNII